MNPLRLEPVFLSHSTYATLRERHEDLPLVNTEQTFSGERLANLDGVESALQGAGVLVGEHLNGGAVLRDYRHSLTGHAAIYVCYLIGTEECNLRVSVL